MELSKAQLSEYNFTILVDASGSMAESHSDGTRWKKAQKIAQAVADFAGTVDDNGIDIITFGGQFDPSRDIFLNTTADKIPEIFNIRQPSGSTPMAEALKSALGIFSSAQGKKAFIVVVTDGIPNNKVEVADLIKATTQSIQEDNDLTILFLQVGEDAGATQFLTELDDNLKGAKFDVVDRKTEAEYANLTFEQLFYQAQAD